MTRAPDVECSSLHRKPFSKSHGAGLVAGQMGGEIRGGGGWFDDAPCGGETLVGEGGAKRGEYEVRTAVRSKYQYEIYESVRTHTRFLRTSSYLMRFEHPTSPYFRVKVSFGEGQMGLSVRNVDARAEVSKVEAGEFQIKYFRPIGANRTHEPANHTHDSPSCTWK